MPGLGKARTLIGVAGGALLLASGLAHAFLGWPAMAAALAAVEASEDLSGALAVGWYFGSMAMLVFGMIVLGIAIRKADPCAVRFIAIGYLVFGLAAWLARDLNPHFLLFIATGVVLAVFGFSPRD
jgi:hypothetical protein